MIFGIPDPVPTDDFARAIARWSIREVIYGNNNVPRRHLVGFILQGSLGRTSSDIQSFNKKKMVIETRSGRLHKLHGRPGDHPDSEHVWRRWKDLTMCKMKKM